MKRFNKWKNLRKEGVDVNTKRKIPPRVVHMHYQADDGKTYFSYNYLTYLKVVAFAPQTDYQRDLNAKMQQYTNLYDRLCMKRLANLDFDEFSAVVNQRDLEMMKVYSMAYFFPINYANTIPDDNLKSRIIQLVLATYDIAIYDCFFRTTMCILNNNTMIHAMQFINNNADEKQAHFIFRYLLDSPSQICANEDFVTYMVSRGDMELMEMIMTYETSFYAIWNEAHYGHYSGSAQIIMQLLRFGNESIPFVERLLAEIPQLANVKLWHTHGAYDTPLEYCVSSGYEELVAILLKHYADPTRAIALATTDSMRTLLANAQRTNGVVKGAVSAKAIKRIMRDWQEVMEEPPSNSVRAFPMEDDIFEWHIVITPPAVKHPLRGVNFHFIMRFPTNYPESPPKISGSQDLKHPNYFNGFLCLDMLREDEHHYGYGSSWSSAYTANSILMQLQSFMFAREVEQDYDYSITNNYSQGDIKDAYRSCIGFKCTDCGFNHTWKGFEQPLAVAQQVLGKNYTSYPLLKQIIELPLLPPPDYGQYVDSTKLKQKKKTKMPYESNASLITLDDNSLLMIMDYLVRLEDLHRIAKVCKHTKRVCEKFAVMTRRELKCFYSKVSFLEDILGVGVKAEFHRTGELKSLSSRLDYISKSAFFDDYLRTTTWKEPFDYWLPLMINDRHTNLAMPYFQATIVAMVLNISFKVSRVAIDMRREDVQAHDKEISDEKLSSLVVNFDPLMVLEVIPKLMNQTIVSMMRDKSDEGVYLHHSTAALESYSSYHHMLLEMCNRFPVVQQAIDKTLEQFCRHESARVKMAQPDLGELLVYLSAASEITWATIAPFYLQESFDRSVVWLLDGQNGKGGHGELAYMEQSAVCYYRMKESFASAHTGLRLLMFQVFFLEKVGRPAGKSTKDILNRLKASYGKPPLGVPSLLQKECKLIYNVKSYSQFYNRIGIPYPGDEGMTTILRQAVVNSERKGYHVINLSTEKLLAWRKRVDKHFAKNNQHLVPDLSTPMADLAIQPPSPQVSQVPLQPNTPPVAPVKLYVGNLSFRVTALDLEYVFKQFGKLVSSEIIYDANNRSKGFGFIEVENEDVATTLLEMMQGADVDRRPVKISRAHPGKPKHGAPPVHNKFEHPPNGIVYYNTDYTPQQHFNTNNNNYNPNPNTTHTTNNNFANYNTNTNYHHNFNMNYTAFNPNNNNNNNYSNHQRQ